MIRVVIDTILDFLPIQTWSCFGYILHSLTFLELFLCTSCDLQIQSCLKHHVNVTSKHDCGTPKNNKNIESALRNVSCSIIQTLLYGYIMNSLAPLSKWWCTCWSNMYIMLYFSLWKVTLLNLVYKHIFLSIVLFNLSCNLTYLSSDNSLLM